MRPSTAVATLLGCGILLAAAVLLRDRRAPSQPPPPANPRVATRLAEDDPALPERPRDTDAASTSLPPATTPGTSLDSRVKAQETIAARFADKLQLVDDARERFIDDYVTYARPILETDQATAGPEAYRQLLDGQWLLLEARLRGYLADEQVAATRRLLGRK